MTRGERDLERRRVDGCIMIRGERDLERRSLPGSIMMCGVRARERPRLLGAGIMIGLGVRLRLRESRDGAWTITVRFSERGRRERELAGGPVTTMGLRLRLRLLLLLRLLSSLMTTVSPRLDEREGLE